MMFKILVVCALSQELAVVKKQIKKANIPGLKIDFLHTGMGNYNTIFSLTSFLKNKDYDFILNIGISGLRIKDKSFVIDRFYQISNIFNISNQKELIVPVFVKFGKLLSCINAELPIKDIDNSSIFLGKNIKIEKSFIYSFGAILLDMESWGFEFVMEKFNIPRLILKVPVDFNKEELEQFNYEKALDLLKENIDYSLLLEEIKVYLEKNGSKNKENLEKYFSFFSFSTREKEIFSFLYKKYKFKIGGDFDSFLGDFLRENNKLDKKLISKKFLKYLEKKLKG